MNPIAVGLVTAAALCAALWVAYSTGHDHGVQQCQLALAKVEKAKAEIRETKLADAKLVQDQLASHVQQLERELAERQPEKEVIYQTITKEVVKYAQSSPAGRCQPDADFVRVWNAAKDNRDPTGAGTGERGNTKPLPGDSR